MVHGDFRIDNVIFDPAKHGVVRAVIDWEMSTLGDPAADLGLHIAYCDQAFDPVLGGSAAATSARLPGRHALVERYFRRTGRQVEDFDFYVGLGFFKAAIIAEGIHARFLRDATQADGFGEAGQAVAPLVAAGLRVLSAR